MQHWEDESLNKLPIKDGFRYRGTEMTRLETFTDAAFAFAITMLVISVGTIPDTYENLILALKDIPAFTASFASIAFLWFTHHKWSRRYGLDDGVSTLLTLALIFTMLVYVYPLKMIFSACFAWISSGYLPTTFELNSTDQLIHLFIIYGLGVVAVSFIYSLLFYRAKKLKDTLILNETEIILTNMDTALSTVLGITGLISVLFAWLMPISLAVWSGFIYLSLPFSMTATSYFYMNKLEAS